MPRVYPRRGWVLALGAALVLALAAGCARDELPRAPARRAFYAWRTTFELSPPEVSALRELGAARLYLRVFDVATSASDAAAHPVAPVSFASQVPAGLEVVPVVFLREGVLRGLDRDGTARLGERLVHEVERLSAAGGFRAREVQLDCDWTETTRDAYFALLRAVKGELAAHDVALSATIRLHQVKYRERTGVPPVDRGMLMFYNMGAIGAPASGTSIFDPASAAKYLERLPDYPLALDVALPIWSWTLHVRDGRVEGLLQSTDPSELEGTDGLRRITPEGSGAPITFEATESTFFHGALLRAGDRLVGETTRPADALAAAELVAPHLAALSAGSPPRTVTLFDLSERNLARHDVQSLDRLFRTLR